VPYLIPQTGRRACHLGDLNLYKSCVPCPCAYLQVLGLPIMILHRTFYYLGYPLGRFAGLKHRQLARQVGEIITTRRIRRTFSSSKSVCSFNLVNGAGRSNSHELLFDDSATCTSSSNQLIRHGRGMLAQSVLTILRSDSASSLQLTITAILIGVAPDF
jgi:hypothetical protein